jgi:hypothetical protein
MMFMERVRLVSGQSKGVEVEWPTRVRTSIGTKELMIWVCFSRSGIGSITVLPEKETFTRILFVKKVLDNFDKERVEMRLKKRARGTFLRLDNTPTDRPDDDFDRLAIARLSNPLYSPDLAQCDFWLFVNRKTKLKGNTFTSAIELMAKVNEILMDNP